jgi:hypothetical protein
VEGNQPSIRNASPYVIIGAIVLSFFWFSFKNPSKQIAELSGTIEAVTFRGANDQPGAPDRTAVIRLTDGTIVQAHILAQLNVHAGQHARIAVYEHVLSAERRYELVEARDSN